ncbi:MAG: hypothetical protein H7329_14590 [Opitutaceae bacterium]|nr:hypothetical protein [Cytophagales bacterium]
MPYYSKVLAETFPEKVYNNFLKKLIELNFLKDEKRRTTIKEVSIELNEKADKITKWIHSIYEDILELLYNKPELFKTDGTLCTLTMGYFDSYCCIKIYLPFLPRKGEHFDFSFTKAKTGTYNYRVKHIMHEVNEDKYEAVIMLTGDMGSDYGDWLREKALFHQEIGYRDILEMNSFQVDDLLRKLYRS